jgi:eukaryotic-like serine/threonine-protein kinase
MAPDDPSHEDSAPRDTLRARARAATASTDEVALPQPLAAYALGAVIGAGGVGEVIAAHDRRIGREVALKRLKTPDPSDDAIARFLREARIQARLDHPSVVPVHELGHDEHGRPYFTMKQLSGVTLAQHLARVRSHTSYVIHHTNTGLLRAFADVCHAIDLAHSRGIIHRDLKPANIMLGDFGAVYVLDWGLARELGGEPDSRQGPNAGDDVETREGELLGTPGYMAPEQIEDAASVERPADVYSLGAILFELLAGEPLHPRGPAGLTAALEDVERSPARRMPDRAIPPELDALCVAMLARAPEERPTAHQVAVQIEAYLDGDRDVTARRALARDDLARARVAFGAGDRVEAMRAAGRALALDPENREAAELVSRLMLEPPRVPPPALRDALSATEAETIRQHARSSMIAFILLLAFVPVVIWNGVRSWPLVIAIAGLAFVLGTVAFAMMRVSRVRGVAGLLCYFVGSGAMVVLLSRLCGPFMVVPAIACVFTMSGLMYPPLARRPVIVVAITLVSWLGPVLLEQAGILAATWRIVGGTIETTSHTLAISSVPTQVFLYAATIVTIVVTALHASSLSRSNLDAQHKLVSQAWHLQLLLPRVPGF